MVNLGLAKGALHEAEGNPWARPTLLQPRPKAVPMENVPALKQLEAGRFAQTFTQTNGTQIVRILAVT
jgi:hypothetical protein